MIIQALHRRLQLVAQGLRLSTPTNIRPYIPLISDIKASLTLINISIR